MTITIFAQRGFAYEDELPEIESELYLWSGYRLIGLDGSQRAEEYEYMNDSIVLGGELYAFPFPNRIHVEGEFLNSNDYFGDVGYAYKDLVLFRWVTRRLYHNLDNLTLTDFNTALPPPSPGVDQRDTGVTYGMETGLDKFYLRLKTPDYPLHVYTEGHIFHRKGTRQQRFLGGSGYLNDLERVSTKRDVHWQTADYTIGTNNHLGPLEMDVSHYDRKFTVKGDEVLTESYAAAGFPAGSLRAAGTFEHDRIPELESKGNSLRLHTAYTGSLVATGTLTNLEKKNNFSGAEAESWVGHGEFIWMPTATFSLLTKYRYQETDVDNPNSVTVVDQANPSNTYVVNVRPSIDTKVARLTGLMRYKPYRGVTLKGEYKHVRKEREETDAAAWNLPDSTNRNIGSLSLYWRIFNKAKLTAKWRYERISQETDDTRVVLNVEPEQINQGIVSLSWTARPWITALFNYNITRDKTDTLQILDDHGAVVSQADDRARLNQRIFGSVTFQLANEFSVTPSYTYVSRKTKQDLVYDSLSPQDLIVDEDIEDKSEVHSYSLNAAYVPIENLRLNMLVTYVESRGEFYPKTSEALNPITIAQFSEVSKDELTCELEGMYECKNGWGVGLRFKYTDYDDNSFDNPESGQHTSTMMMVSKKW